MAEDPTGHDQLFKELIRTFFFEFIELFLPEVYQYLLPGPIEFLDKEVFNDLAGGDRNEVDLLARPPDRSRIDTKSAFRIGRWSNSPTAPFS